MADTALGLPASKHMAEELGPSTQRFVLVGAAGQVASQSISQRPSSRSEFCVTGAGLEYWQGASFSSQPR